MRIGELTAKIAKFKSYKTDYDELVKKIDKYLLKKQLKIKNKDSKAYKEMIDAEYVLRFFTLREQWSNFPGNMRMAMEKHRTKHKSDSTDQIKSWTELFNTSIKYAESIWGEKAFKRPDINTYRDQMLQGVYDVQMIPFSLLSKTKQQNINKRADIIRKEFLNLYNTDSDFQGSIRQFTSNTDRVHTRISMMLNKLEEIL